ncbi:hypothetical protein [Kiloniella antarctica]|uniref:DUF2946 domain-containing protein n=1 Tax=Kiloniella antarctica TaxID=1550907 RepID=A0ABW5BHQ4_9PROT
MHKSISYKSNHDRCSLAVLSIAAVCLKTLLPFITAFFISHTASAQTQHYNTATESAQELVAALQFICTPTGILLAEGTNNSTPNAFLGHCDHCITGGFISLDDTTFQAEASFLLNQLQFWHITEQNNVIIKGYSLPASRAPPVA